MQFILHVDRVQLPPAPHVVLHPGIADAWFPGVISNGNLAQRDAGQALLGGRAIIMPKGSIRPYPRA